MRLAPGVGALVLASGAGCEGWPGNTPHGAGVVFALVAVCGEMPNCAAVTMLSVSIGCVVDGAKNAKQVGRIAHKDVGCGVPCARFSLVKREHVVGVERHLFLSVSFEGVQTEKFSRRRDMTLLFRFGVFET